MSNILHIPTPEEIAAALVRFLPQESAKAWDVPECAAYLGVTDDTVRYLASKGELPAFRIGKLWRFHPHEVKAWQGTKF